MEGRIGSVRRETNRYYIYAIFSQEIDRGYFKYGVVAR